MKKTLAISLLLLLGTSAWAANLKGKVVHGETGENLFGVEVVLENTFYKSQTDEEGQFAISGLPNGEYRVLFFLMGHALVTEQVAIDGQDIQIEIDLPPLERSLNEVQVTPEQEYGFGISRLKAVDGMAIYASKKNEVVVPQDLNANLAQNQGRQVYAKVAGLNIWESDGGGLQLGIGGRGLSPNRTSNFNTRQSGYDISADPLGYPESYYTPPTEAVQRIEVVRGAASLQYGPQFGGMLNFKMKQGNREKPLEVVSRQTVGSFGFVNSFNSIGGTRGAFNYYGYAQFKRGDGWRPNSDFESASGYGALRFQANERLTVRLEYTHLGYLAHQAGGLTDAQFEADPRQSNRTRNWFRIRWNIAALTIDYRFSDQTSLQSQAFGLHSSRDALGNLGRIDRPDVLDETRTLIQGQFRNFGNETRLIHRYKVGQKMGTLLTGVRYYQGQTRSLQGEADASADPNFSFLPGEEQAWSDYTFPNQNVAVFGENLFHLSDRWTVTPGFRMEFLRTGAEGFYQEVYRHPNTGEVLFSNRQEENNRTNRHFFLLGAGSSYRPGQNWEVYGNFSQNYRPINFNDIRVVNPNQVVDPDIKDERGFSTDLGVRGNWKDKVNFDVSVFMLRYLDRIGSFLTTVPDATGGQRVVRMRSNIANSQSTGVEAFAEFDIWKIIRGSDAQTGVSWFVNLAHVTAEYRDGEDPIFDGNRVELVPEITARSGITLRRKSWGVSYQFSYTSEQYSDATNAEFYPTAVAGTIPAYHVSDLSGHYQVWRLRFEAGVNNLTDERYFTRRAVGYPGPGIIPSDARSFYFTLQYKW